MKRFNLQRDVDVSGCSGVGVVAQGIQFDNGRIALQWLREPRGLSFYESVEDMLSVHGHAGRTRVIWIDKANRQKRSAK